MNSEDFIKGIKIGVHDSSVRGIVANLEHPPGRKPAQRLVELSQWFHSLSATDKARVKETIQIAVHTGIFGMLAVLDGVRVIEDRPDKGKLELSYHRGDEHHLLTDSSQEFLHDIYQGEVFEQVFGSAA